jgi:two-component system, NarL family, sensor kinase
MPKNLVTLALLLLALVATAQPQEKRDSLLQLLSHAKEDSGKVLLYLQLGEAYESNEPEKAKQYYRQAGGLSQQIHYAAGYYKHLSYLGNAFMIKGVFDSSLVYMQQALAAAITMNDSASIGISLFNIGINYRETSDFEKAIDYCLRGRKIIEKLGQKGLEAQVNNALQVLYFNRSEYDKAIFYGEKSLAQSRDLKMAGQIARSLINLSLSYVETGQLDKALTALEEVLQSAEAKDDLQVRSSVLQNLAGVALKKHDYPLTIKYSEQSLALNRQIKSLDGEATALRGLAATYLQLGKYEKAMDFAKQALNIDVKNNYRREEASVLMVMSSIAYASGDAATGEEYNERSIKILEAMIKEILSQQSSDLEKKYETEKKESRIKQLETEQQLQASRLHQKNIINYGLLAGALTLIIIGILSYRTHLHKQKLQQQRIGELETREKLTATEAVLKGEEQERVRLARDLHDGLGGMLSGIKYSMNNMKGNLIMTPENQQAFERSMDMLDSSIREMRRVAHNMMPEALVKFGLDTALKDFCQDITQSGALQVNYQSIGMEQPVIDQTKAISIYRIVQELVNNAVKHAAAGSAIVQLTRSSEQLMVTVEDDGKGFDQNILQRAEGMGWANIRNRIEFLKAKLDINSSSENGTSVLIEINL